MPRPSTSAVRVRRSCRLPLSLVCATLSTAAWIAPLAAQRPATATQRPWHLTAPQLMSECRTATADMRRSIDAALDRPIAQQTFAHSLRPIEQAYGEWTTRTNMLAYLMYLSTDRAVRDSSTACNQLVTNYGVERKADPRIYAAAQRAARESLSTLDRALVQRYVENGRHGGAALDSTTRARATAMLQRLNDLARDFGIALSTDSSRLDLTESDLAELPPQLRDQVVQRGAERLLPTDASTVEQFMRNHPSSDARRRFYLTYDRRGGEANLERLRHGVALRDTLAHVFGFPSWAAYQLDLKVAKTPQRAIEFIKQVDQGLIGKARRELQALAPFAQADHLDHPIALWDVRYYMDKLRRARYALDPNEIRRYFPVEHVVPAVLRVYEELFGISFVEVEPADVWAPGVREFVVRDVATHQPLGTAYLDLFPRQDKYGHFAVFPIVTTWSKADGTRELPAAAIVGNWPPPGGSEPSLLSHGDVITFFHEFGHAVAVLADRSPYVTLGDAGLRQDFAEAPSQMLENWMWEPSVLARVSKHHVTGRPLPDSLVRRMIALKHLSAGYDGTRQAFLAAFDLALHTTGPSVDPLALWKRTMAEFTPVSYLEGGLGPASFGHLMLDYDAGYYGYLWSRAYAQDLYTRFAREGPLNPRTGRAYRETILAMAATEEPDVLLLRFLGRGLSYEAFFAEMGISSGRTEPTP